MKSVSHKVMAIYFRGNFYLISTCVIVETLTDTLMCFSIGTPKTITLKCVSIGTLKTIDFPFGTNGKLMFLGVPIFKLIIFRMLFAQILGHLKINNFFIWNHGKFIIFRCHNT